GIRSFHSRFSSVSGRCSATTSWMNGTFCSPLQWYPRLAEPPRCALATKEEEFRVRITHIVTSLHPGGAQVMLYRLLSRMDRGRFEPSVIALSESGSIGVQIEALGIPVYAVGMKPEIPNPV